MEIEGQLLICDRCGKTEFLKRVPSKYVEFQVELVPDGWSGAAATAGEALGGNIKQLCPSCTNDVRALFEKFMRGDYIHMDSLYKTPGKGITEFIESAINITNVTKEEN